MSAYLNLENITLAYRTSSGSKTVVHDLSLELDQGSIGCLLGASGCGKTTILRAIAGFEPLQSGQIVLGGQSLSTRSDSVRPENRNVGMMFQDYALFPHLTASRNIGFGLRKLSKAARQERIAEMLELVGLQDFSHRYPHEMSGGQQQRVALARALAPKPDLLLLDEPFSNLDVDTRERLAFEVRDILQKTGLTAILVTHNQAEAFAIADRIGVMKDGHIIQWDTAYGLHHSPVNDFVANFIRREALLNQRAQAFLRGEPVAS
ncbi:ABC transporter ATP-binding protein [Paenalcaligenes niemegkensis]|uniref:ABC transporter ATP-binding protein n=1 Tax=Paenalcaligenes niemegkensis TaxID=2895469 RepID=UPI001EE812ED|nr:ABC transporter ATP-binding protein [Paenalcaligenes niemegkensis]MCQ9616345.1 ABC transporter ATP-binding protein [Paenalcaligenes niemegkensis]